MTKTSFDQVNQLVVHHATDKPILDSRIHIWLCDLDDNSQIGSWNSMSASEHARVTRLKSPLDRRRMTRRFIFTRKVLGNLVGVSLDGWEFYYDSRGKPAPICIVNEKGDFTRLYFNISHSENILALAVLLDCNVGIDVEVVRPELDFLSIAKLHFDKASFEMLCATPPAKISKLFYRLWTRKEALAKLKGSGIANQTNDNLLDYTPRSLFSFECNVGKKEIVGACTCETLPNGENLLKKCEPQGASTSCCR